MLQVLLTLFCVLTRARIKCINYIGKMFAEKVNCSFQKSKKYISPELAPVFYTFLISYYLKRFQRT